MKKVLFSMLCVTTSFIANEVPAKAASAARVCTHNYDGYLHVRRWASTAAPIDGRYFNEQTIWLSGQSFRDRYGFRWYSTSHGWVRGDYLCNEPQFHIGPGNYR